MGQEHAGGMACWPAFLPIPLRQETSMKETVTQAGAITDRKFFKDVKEMGTKEKWTDYTLESNMRARTLNLCRHELSANAIFSTKFILPFLTLPWHSGLTLIPGSLSLSPKVSCG